MTTELFYFSGTGNSLFIAGELRKRIPGTRLTAIAGCPDTERYRTEAGRIGFVFPVHALTLPLVVKRFVNRLDAVGAEYVFAVATREGTVFHGFDLLDRLLKKKHLTLDAGFIVNMYGNDSRHGRYTVPSEAVLKAIEERALRTVDFSADVIAAGKRFREKDTGVLIETAPGKLGSWLIERSVLLGMSVSEHIGGVNYFYHDAGCSGCGICAKVCLSSKIQMENGEPVWRKKVLCSMCFACLNFCPRKSVQIRSIPGVRSCSIENGRYPHPYAEVKDIAAQKAGT